MVGDISKKQTDRSRKKTRRIEYNNERGNEDSNGMGMGTRASVIKIKKRVSGFV